MFVRSCVADRIQPWYQEYQLSGFDAGWGGSQQDTPRTGDGDDKDPSSVGDISLATWKIALLMPQRQRAAREL